MKMVGAFLSMTNLFIESKITAALVLTLKIY